MNPRSGSEQVVDASRALGVAYRFINRRERTEFEVRSRLARAEFTPPEIDAAVAELTEFGYVDDARYARLFAQDRRSLDAWGSERIARALRERGVDRELISAAIDGEPTPTDDLGRAIVLLGERFPAGPGSERDHSRAFGVLARKGYGSEVAADAVRAWARATGD